MQEKTELLPNNHMESYVFNLNQQRENNILQKSNKPPTNLVMQSNFHNNLNIDHLIKDKSKLINSRYQKRMTPQELLKRQKILKKKAMINIFQVVIR